jgi:hypothetical protein
MIALCAKRFPAMGWSVADMHTLSLGERFGAIVVADNFFHLRPGAARHVPDLSAARVEAGQSSAAKRLLC